jgi:hypothetical protein
MSIELVGKNAGEQHVGDQTLVKLLPAFEDGRGAVGGQRHVAVDYAPRLTGHGGNWRWERLTIDRPQFISAGDRAGR